MGKRVFCLHQGELHYLKVHTGRHTILATAKLFNTGGDYTQEGKELLEEPIDVRPKDRPYFACPPELVNIRMKHDYG